MRGASPIDRAGTVNTGEQKDATPRYRYRTAALIGPWRRVREEAIDDAVKAGQAVRGPDDRHVMTWLVHGEIEMMAGKAE